MLRSVLLLRRVLLLLSINLSAVLLLLWINLSSVVQSTCCWTLRSISMLSIDLSAVDRPITAVAAAAAVDRSLCCRQQQKYSPDLCCQSISLLSTTTKVLSGSLLSIDLSAVDNSKSTLRMSFVAIII
jgi:hypothetical protein